MVYVTAQKVLQLLLRNVVEATIHFDIEFKLVSYMKSAAAARLFMNKVMFVSGHHPIR